MGEFRKFPLMPESLRRELAKRRGELEVVAVTKASSAEIQEEDVMSDAERKRRGAAAAKAKDEDSRFDGDADDSKVKDMDADADDEKTRSKTGLKSARKGAMSFSDIVFGGGSNHKAETFDIEDTGQIVRRDDEDRLGRAYEDGAVDRLGAGDGSGEGWEGTTEDITYRPTQFSRDAAPFIGGETVPETSGGPVHSYLDKEDVNSPVRVGPNFLMSPAASGLAPAAGYRPSEPTRVLKSEKRPVRKGLFRSVIDDPSNLSGFSDGESR